MTTLAAVSANFTRDLEQNYALIAALTEEARTKGVDFLVFPEAAIGGYLSSLGEPRRHRQEHQTLTATGHSAGRAGDRQGSADHR